MIDLSGMFWCPRESGRRQENVYGMTGNVCFSQLGRQCQWALLRFTFAPGLIGLVFLLFKTYILLGTVQKKQEIRVAAEPAGSAPLFVKPYHGHAMLLSAWVSLRHRGVVYPGVGLPSSSSWCCFPRRWAAHIVVGCPTSVFVPLHRRGVTYLRVGLPTSLWVALP